MKSKEYYPKTMIIILYLIILMYLIFLYLDIFKDYYYNLSNMLKFICIILCFTLSTLTRQNPFEQADVKLLQFGLFLTMIADFFLLIIDDYYEIGVGVFSIAQITYSIRYDIKNKRKVIRNYITLFVLLNIAFVTVNLLYKQVDVLVFISIFYGFCLITNVLKSLRCYKYKIYPNPNGAMIALGMILFMFCDINVALYNILKSMSISEGFISNMSSISMWLFYLPSQVLLAISGYNYKNTGYCE